MCGRFSQYFTWAEIHAFSSLLPAAPPSNLEPRWTISPTQQVGVIRSTESGAWSYSDMRWGLWCRLGGRSRSRTSLRRSTPAPRLSPKSPCSDPPSNSAAA
ncbi:SOS response-associated peptidase family protein [Kaistia defluvii]|uniref:SOS response-associated peptidase family protein n=1 Tax=Kaistia defluvii TaxID=410841 RepID=UPI0033993161